MTVETGNRQDRFAGVRGDVTFITPGPQDVGAVDGPEALDGLRHGAIRLEPSSADEALARLAVAHRHCTANEAELRKSKVAGCFYCKAVFPVQGSISSDHDYSVSGKRAHSTLS